MYIVVLILGSFSIAVFWWDGLYTRQELKKHKDDLSLELNPYARWWMNTFGIDLGLIITRVLASGMMVIVMFLVPFSAPTLTLIILTAMFESWLVGWHMSGNFHMEDVERRYTIKKKRRKSK
jgi:hypothetical protein